MHRRGGVMVGFPLADDLKRKTALVTGATTGIGRSIVDVLTKHGVRFALADINLEKAMQSFDKIGDQAVAVWFEVQPEQRYSARWKNFRLSPV